MGLPQPSNRETIVAVCIAALGVAALYIAVRPALRQESLADDWSRFVQPAKALPPRASKEQVVEALGEPFIRSDNGVYFYYSIDARGRTHRDPELRLEFAEGRLVRMDAVPYVQLEFESADWRSASVGRRGCMVKDLLKKHARRGLLEPEILDLLGPPNPMTSHELGGLVYDLGVEWPPRAWLQFDTSTDNLVITFDGWRGRSRWRVLNTSRLDALIAARD